MTIVPPEIERLAELLGAQSGKTAEQVIREAVEAQARIAGLEIIDMEPPERAVDVERVREITSRLASRPLRDKRTPREIRDEAWGQDG